MTMVKRTLHGNVTYYGPWTREGAEGWVKDMTEFIVGLLLEDKHYARLCADYRDTMYPRECLESGKGKDAS